MERQERKNKRKLFLVAFLGIMLCISLVSGIYAKYVSEISGTDTVGIAKWKWTVNGDNLATLLAGTGDNKLTINLFDTIYDSNGTDKETDVADGMIAPGTTGKFQIALANLSDVNAKYSIDMESESTLDPAPKIEYSVNGGDWSTTLGDISATNIAMGGTATVTVDWRWVYYDTDDQDEADTAVGFAAATATTPQITVTAKLKLVQVD